MRSSGFWVVDSAMRLIGRTQNFRRRVVELFILALSLQLISIAMPLFTQWIIDSVIPSGDRGLLAVLISAFAACILLKLALDIFTSWGGVFLGVQLDLQWSTKIKWHMLGLPMKWFGLHDIGDALSRFQSINYVQAIVTNGVINLIINSVFLILSTIVMVSYSVGLAGIALGATVVYLIVRLVSFRRLQELSHLQLILDGETQTTFIENFQCIESIKVACVESLRMKKWVDRYKRSTENSVALKRFGIFYGGVHGFVEGGETILILGVGSSLVIDGGLTLGMLMAFIAYKSEFTSRAQKVVDGIIEFSMLKMHIDRITGIVEYPREGMATERALSDSQVDRIEVKRVQLENIYYRYDDGGPWIIENLNLEIAAGEHVVITGVTGCGKSTLIKIILGLIEPTSGQVKINGIPLKKIGLVNWRSKFSAVLQSDQLFAGTVSENISLSENGDCNLIKDAAVVAQIDSEIEGFEDGYGTQLQCGSANISGGQKQRIMIARALYRNAPVLILDEATSHLDEVTEKRLNASLFKKNKTIISIAHRVETIRSGTRVYCMRSA